MKNVIISRLNFVAIALLPLTSFSQSAYQKQVEKVVDAYVKAMVSADSDILQNILDDKVSYGHSGGLVETKQDLISNLLAGTSDFVTMDVTNQKIIFHNKTSLVRHHIDCETNDRNKPGHVSLDVLTVWKKKKRNWVIIARQAVKNKI